MKKRCQENGERQRWVKEEIKWNQKGEISDTHINKCDQYLNLIFYLNF